MKETQTMKKIMMAAAIVCAAVVTQAASVTWNSGSSKLVDKDGATLTALDSGCSIALIVLSDNTGWTEGTWTAAAGSVTELATAAIGTGKSAGKIVGTQYVFDYGTQPFADGAVLAVVFKDATGAYDQLEYQASGAVMTDTLSVSGLAADQDLWAKTLTFAKSGNVMAPESIPEPTSGLLMVLGLAGLALRRRRA